MRMKNPVHPGKLVKANLEELGLSVAAAAKALGVTRQQLYNVIGGKSAVTPEMAVRFEKGLAAALTCGCGCKRPTTLLKYASAKARFRSVVSGQLTRKRRDLARFSRRSGLSASEISSKAR